MCLTNQNDNGNENENIKQIKVKKMDWKVYRTCWKLLLIWNFEKIRYFGYSTRILLSNKTNQIKAINEIIEELNRFCFGINSDSNWNWKLICQELQGRKDQLDIWQKRTTNIISFIHIWLTWVYVCTSTYICMCLVNVD